MKTSKKFAMMLMGSEYNTKKDYVVMQTESTETHIFTVNTPEQAVELAGQLAQQALVQSKCAAPLERSLPSGCSTQQASVSVWGMSFALRSKRSCPTDFGVSRNFG